jgi:hypothetical protein
MHGGRGGGERGGAELMQGEGQMAERVEGIASILLAGKGRRVEAILLMEIVRLLLGRAEVAHRVTEQRQEEGRGEGTRELRRCRVELCHELEMAPALMSGHQSRMLIVESDEQ